MPQVYIRKDLYDALIRAGKDLQELINKFLEKEVKRL